MCRPNKHPRPQPASRSHGRNLQQLPKSTNLARARDTLLLIHVLLPIPHAPSRNPTKNQTHPLISLSSITTQPPVLRAKPPRPTLAHPSLGSPRSRATNQSHVLLRRLHLFPRRFMGRCGPFPECRTVSHREGLCQFTSATGVSSAERDHAIADAGAVPAGS